MDPTERVSVEMVRLNIVPRRGGDGARQRLGGESRSDLPRSERWERSG